MCMAVRASAKARRKSEVFRYVCESPGAEKHIEESVPLASVVTCLQ